VYQINKWDPKQFDWTKKLADADYVGPTCQYCHMRGAEIEAKTSLSHLIQRKTDSRHVFVVLLLAGEGGTRG